MPPITRAIILWFRYLTGTIKDDNVCEFSYYFFDIHDYKKTHGGNGEPWHMYEYTCKRCGKDFTI